MTKPLQPTPPWLRRYTKFVAVATLFLIFAGAMVTSTGSGLAVPDWPLSYGMIFPPMVGGIFYEHGHRMVAAAVGLLTVIQAVWLQRREPRRFLRRLGWIAVFAVIVQGVLGGLTVIFLLPPAISISHAALAELFLCTNVTIAFFASYSFNSLRQRPTRHSDLARLTTALAVVSFCQILAGALMRHLGAGLAIPDFPLSFGQIVPPFTSGAIAVNYAHRVGALFVVILVLMIAVRSFRATMEAGMRTLAITLLMICATQVTLGAFTVWSGKDPLVTSLHVVTGALLLATSVVACLTARFGDGLSESAAVARLEREVTV